MAMTPFAILASPRLFLSQPRYSTLEFADVGIMRPQPVNNETKDVAHQLRSIYCLASISSAPPTSLPPLHPTSVCAFSNCAAVCEVQDAVSLSSLSPFHQHAWGLCTLKKNKHLKIWSTRAFKHSGRCRYNCWHFKREKVGGNVSTPPLC